MKKNYMGGESLIRPDLRRIAELIEPGSRVLDLGCGDGEFLKYLTAAKQVRGLGIEIDQEKIAECIANGINVIQGDLNNPLEFLESDSFDYVLLTRTLQEIRHPALLLREIVRVGRRGLVGFINFGHIRNRMGLWLNGRMPQSKALPYEWYNTPNIHLGTIRDFRKLCAQLDIAISRAFPIGRDRSWLDQQLPNLLAHACIFELGRK